MFERLRPEPNARRSTLIPVRPAKACWVDLGKVFPVDGVRRAVPDGMDFQATVPGELAMWALTTTGHWVGYVSFVVSQTGAGVRVSQWVLRAALQPRYDAPVRPEQR